MLGWVFVSLAAVMTVLAYVFIFLRGDYNGVIFIVAGLVLAFWAMAEFSKPRRPDKDESAEAS